MNELFFLCIGAAAPVVFGFFYLRNQSLKNDYRVQKIFDYLIMTDGQSEIYLPPVERIIEIRIDNIEIATDRWKHENDTIKFCWTLRKHERVQIMYEVIA